MSAISGRETQGISNNTTSTANRQRDKSSPEHSVLNNDIGDASFLSK
jgi:hypothetical protein